MNSLNSVLLEGNVIRTPAKIDDMTRFQIESLRYHKVDGVTTLEATPVKVDTVGELAKQCSTRLDLGRGIRIVGRLKDIDGEIIIHAEHVEFKPNFNKL